MPASDTSPQVNQTEIKIAGADLPNETMDKLFSVEVESSLYLPSMFTLRFHDDKLELIDAETFKAGNSVEIKMGVSRDTLATVFKGEITALEPEFGEDLTSTLVVRGYDKGHRLNRGTKSRVYVQSTDSDIVQKIAQEAGLSATADSTTQVHEHVFQYAVNDWAFIHERARRNNFEVSVDDGTLYFRKATTSAAVATLIWGQNMRSFQPRMSLTKQAGTVKVRGWDPAQKAAIVGQASTSSSAPATGIAGWGGSLSQSAFSAAEVLEIRHPVRDQSEAETMAKAILDEINAGFLEADGTTFGNPAVKAGKKVKIEKVGTKFSGNYIVTTARHIYTPDGYDTHFTVQGTRARTLSDLVDQSITEQRTGQLWGGIVPALVTNNNDPNNMARVKVKFPWLDDSLESNWARVTGPGAGATRGMLWMPEVNDEVLVAFEHGDFDYPYVVGSLWNGTDAMPDTTANIVKNGKVEVRIMKTRLGHVIKLTDSDNAKTIEIIGSAGDIIKFDETAKKITIESKGDMDIKAAQKITIESQGDMDIKATGNLKLNGATVKVNASGQLEVKAGGVGALESSGPLTVKGAVVNIN